MYRIRILILVKKPWRRVTLEKEMKSYEMFLIFSTHIGEEVRESILKKFCEIINSNGKVVSTDSWGKKRLARPIKKEADGFYTVVNFEAESSVPQEIDRISNITDGLLRSLVLSLEDK